MKEEAKKGEIKGEKERRRKEEENGKERKGEERERKRREREREGERRERERGETLHPQNYIPSHIHPFLKPPHKHTQLQARMLINRPSKSKHSLTQTSQEFHKR